MRKQKYSVDLKPNSKFKYSLTNHDTDFLFNNNNMRSSLDQKIGVTRMPESALFPQKKFLSQSSSLNHQFNTHSKNKRQAYSTSKIYDKKNILDLKLPTLKKSSFFQNPQEKSTNFIKLNKKIISKDIYYQSMVLKGMNQTKQTNYLLTLAANHFHQTIQALKIGRHIRISQHHQPQIKIQKKNPKFKTVFLDLDETLIHCDQNATSYTVKLDFPVEGGAIISAGIRVRPYCKQFLEELATFAQIIIFTASSASYADVVLKYLDPQNKIFAHKLYRHNCTLEKGYYVKDLRIINRRLQDSVLVDNSAYCFMLQPYNGIPILPYYHYGKDKQLMSLLPFLRQVVKADDVRAQIKKVFFWNKYFQNDNDPKKIFQSHFSQNFTH